MARWRAAGNLLVPNTGRSVSALRTALDGSHLTFDYSVLYTGAVLVSSDYSVLRASTLPDGLAEEILDLLQGEDGVTVFATTRLRHAPAPPVPTGLLHRPARTHPRRRPPAHSRCGAPGAHSGRDRAPLGRDRHGLPQPELPRHRSPRLLQGRGPEGAGRPPHRRRRPLLGREHRDLERRRFVERYPHASGRRPRRRHERLPRGGDRRLRGHHRLRRPTHRPRPRRRQRAIPVMADSPSVPLGFHPTSSTALLRDA